MLIKDLCGEIDRIRDGDDDSAKSAMIWILGEYAESIEQVESMLEHFAENFTTESVRVQLSMLTAAVKMYLKKPDDCEELVMEILRKSTEESDNPDLRDRGYIYWRMLSTDPASTKFVVLSDKPDYQTDENDGYDEAFLNNLIENISNLSSVYHITPDDIEVPERDHKKPTQTKRDKKKEEPKAKEDEPSEEEEEEEKKEEHKTRIDKE